MRPIDADALYDQIARKQCGPGSFSYQKGFKHALERVAANIKKAPTLDYAPVKHGEFEFQEFEYIPGLCVAPVHCKTCDTTYFTINKDGKRTACCPYCGARMDGKEDVKDG